MEFRFIFLMLSQALLSLAFLVSCGSGEEEEIRTYYIPADGSEQADGTAGNSPTSPNTGSPSGSDPVATPPPPQAPEGTSLLGAIVRVSPLGVVEGWAVDSDDLTKTINVSIYYEGTEDGGTLLTTVPANIDGFDNNSNGAHRFVFNLPANAKPGTSKKLFVKLDDGAGQQGYLSATGLTYTAYSPKQAGKDIYNADLQGAMTQSCAGCHPGEVNYENHYTLLIDAAPVNGGTATTNRLIVKASGGLNHGGNNRCGNINSGICANLQRWWQAEFQ